MPINIKNHIVIFILAVVILGCAVYGVTQYLGEVKGGGEVAETGLVDDIAQVGTSVSNPTNMKDEKLPAETEIVSNDPATEPGTVTDIFAGTIISKTGNIEENGKPAAQYEFEVTSGILSESERKGAANGIVTISLSSDVSTAYDSFGGSGGDTPPGAQPRSRFYIVNSYHNPSTGWYEVKSYRVTFVDYEYSANFSDDRILVGASHNIFIGKVIEESGTKRLGSAPETQYRVGIIDNVKGGLSGEVIVNQQGGYENGTLYLSEKSIGLLTSGATYLFSTRYNKAEDWHTINPYPTATKLLSSDSGVNIEQLKQIVESDVRVQELKTAYPNEVLLDADVKHGNTLNSYSASRVQ